MSVFYHLVHVMLVYQSCGFYFLTVLPNIVEHVCIMLYWFGVVVFSSREKFGVLGSLVWNKRFISCYWFLVSQGLSKHRQTCFHNAQLVWKSLCFRFSRTLYAWILGLKQTFNIMPLVLVSQGLFKHCQTCVHNAQLV